MTRSPSLDGDSESFVVAPTGGERAAGDEGGTTLGAGERDAMLRRHVANPDDPPVSMPRRDRPGDFSSGPFYAGTPGRMAIVQGQVYIVAVILIAQLFLVTTALFELLSGRTDTLWWISLASLIGFGIALLVALWPRSRIRGF